MVHAIINSVQYNIAELEIEYDICKSSGTASFIVDRAVSITPFSEVEIVAYGTTCFKGYVDLVNVTPLEGTLVSCESPMILTKRTWFQTTYISEGETASYWEEHFFNLSSLTNYSLEHESRNIPEDHSWGFSTAFEALKNLAQITDSQVYPDRTGKIIIKPMAESGVVKTISHYETADTQWNNESIRNRAVVWGRDVSAEVSTSSPYINESRTAAVSTYLIERQGAAQELAQKILDTFIEPRYIVSLLIDGDASLSLNDYISTPFRDGAITQLRHSYNYERFVTEVVIGEICPNFFGIALKEPPIFLSGVDAGVWMTDSLGDSWENISGTTLLNTTVRAIHSDGTYLWAITDNNIYKSLNKNGTWTLCSKLESFDVEGTTYNSSDFRFKDIITDFGQVYVVAQDIKFRQIVVLMSNDGLNFNYLAVVR